MLQSHFSYQRERSLTTCSAASTADMGQASSPVKSPAELGVHMYLLSHDCVSASSSFKASSSLSVLILTFSPFPWTRLSNYCPSSFLYHGYWVALLLNLAGDL